jgi:hypothetical protein
MGSGALVGDDNIALGKVYEYIGNGSLNVILGANSFRALTTGSNNINLGVLMQEIYYQETTIYL